MDLNLNKMYELEHKSLKKVQGIGRSCGTPCSDLFVLHRMKEPEGGSSWAANREIRRVGRLVLALFCDYIMELN